MASSAKSYDDNDWPEIKGNPISKIGVFPYSGAQIGHPDLNAEQIYMVYRPESELSEEGTINSFRLLPFTDEHAMLGSEGEGLTPAEKKGVHGVIGQDVYFEDGYLKANLKIFSEKVNELIKNGKKELSIGYRCMYDIQSGTFEGQKYDAVQRQIRGNHVALVDEGRSGPDVAVLDRLVFTLDSKDITMKDQEQCEAEDFKKPEGEDEMQIEIENEKEEEKEEAVDDGQANLQALGNALREALSYIEKMAPKSEVDEEIEITEDGEPKEFVSKAEVTDVEEEPKKAAGMDSKAIFREIGQRDALAAKLSKHIGTFDHKEKTLSEVATYGVRKLGLSCKRGHEESILNGYLAAAKTSPMVNVALDSTPRSSQIDEYLKGAK